MQLKSFSIKTPPGKTLQSFDRSEIFSPTSSVSKLTTFKNKSDTQVFLNSLMSRSITKKAPKLVLSIIETKDIENSSPILITPTGYANSKRNAKDGIVFFGTMVNGNPNSKDLIKISQVDYVITSGEHGFGDKHFCIFWDPMEGRKGAYKLQDLYKGTGTFALLSMPKPIELNQVVSFGQNHMTVDALDATQIQIRMLGGSLKGQS